MTEKKWIKPNEGMPEWMPSIGGQVWVKTATSQFTYVTSGHQAHTLKKEGKLELWAHIDPPPPLPKAYADGEWRPMSEPIPEETTKVILMSKEGSVWAVDSWEAKNWRCPLAWMPVPACLKVVPEWVKESAE